MWVHRLSQNGRATIRSVAKAENPYIACHWWACHAGLVSVRASHTLAKSRWDGPTDERPAWRIAVGVDIRTEIALDRLNFVDTQWVRPETHLQPANDSQEGMS